MRRPLAVIGFTFFLALFACNQLGFNAAAGVGAFALLLGIVCLVLKRFRQYRALLAALLSISAACLLFCLTIQCTVMPLKALDGGKTQITGTVVSLPKRAEDTNGYTVAVSSHSLPSAPKTFKVFLWTQSTLQPYDAITAEVTLSAAEQKSYADGIFLNAYSTGEVTSLALEHMPPGYYVLRTRVHAKEVVEGHLSPSLSSLVCGILLGDTDAMDAPLKQQLRDSGISHMVAVSGMHTVVVGQMILMLLTRVFLLNRRLASLLSLAGVWFFIAVCGFPYSSLRAGIMFTLYTLGLVLFRTADSLNSLGAALLLLGGYNVFAASDAGLCLSAAACLGLILLSAPLYRAMTKRKPKNKVLWWLYRGVCLSVSQSLSSFFLILPLSLLYFNSLSLFSVLTNLLTAQAAQLILCCGVLAVAFAFLQPATVFLVKPLLLVCGLAAKYLLWCVRLISALPFASLHTGYPYVPVWLACCLVLLAAALWLVAPGGRRMRLYSLLCVIVLLCGSLSHAVMMRGVTELRMLDVGNGTAVLLFRGRHAALIGCGGDSDSLPPSYRVVQALRARGLDTLDLVVLPDTGEAYAGGAVPLLEQTGARMLVAPCPSGGNDPLAHLSLKDCALYRQNSAKVSLWNDVELQYDLQRARVEITIGQSSILLALPGCEVTTVERPGVLITSTALPDLQGTAPVTLVSGNKPRGGAAVAALSLRGAEAYATGGAGDLSVFTRGRNDFTVRRLSHAGT